MKLKTKISEVMLAFAIWIRGIGINQPAIWYDEAFSLEMSKLPLGIMIRSLARDFNPPLWELILKPFAMISENLAWIRLPSLLASIGSLWILWLIMDRMRATDWQRIWVIALSMLPINIWMAQDARVYALFQLLYLASLLFAIKHQWLGFTASVGLMCYAHSLGFIFAAGSLAVALYFTLKWSNIKILVHDVISSIKNKNNLPDGSLFKLNLILKIIKHWAAGMILAIPSLYMLVGGYGGAGISDHWIPDLIFDYYWQSIRQALFAQAFGIQWQLFGMIMIIAYGLLSLAVTIHILMENDPYKKHDHLIIVSGLAFVIPLVGMMLVSLTYHNIIFYRPLATLSLPLALWLGSATAPVKIRWYKFVMPGIMAVVLFAGVVGYRPMVKGAELNQAAEIINQGEGQILYATGSAALPFSYYVDRQGYIADVDQPAGLLQSDLQDVLGYERREPGPWASWIVLPMDDLLDPDLERELFDLIKDNYYQPVGQLKYWQQAVIYIYKKPGSCGCDS